MPTLAEADARRRFAGARVVRLGTADAEGRPHLVPVVFAVDAVPDRTDTVLIAVDGKPKRSRRLKRLANVEANPSVSLLADHYDDDWSALWWVRADGVGTVREDDAALDRARTLLAERYPQHRADPPSGPVLDVEVRRWSGWAATGS